MKADLHIHSLYSDGIHTPSELAQRAREEGLDLICITDHDNMAGEVDKKQAMEQLGIPFLRGWEISAATDRKVHILGYNCSFGKAYDDFLEKRKEEAIDRAEELIRRANKYLDMDLTMEQIQEENYEKGNVLHVAYAVRAYAKRLGRGEMELYLELFNKGRPLYIVPRRPSPEEAIDVIHKLGGIAVLAHPGRMRMHGKYDLIYRLIDAGIEGIECYYTTHTIPETEHFLEIAHRNNLFVTGGSDFHFDNGIPVFGKPDYEVDENFLAKVLPSVGGGH